MQTAGLDLLDVDPFELVEDEEPFTGSVKATEADLAGLLERALRVIAEFEKPSGHTGRRGPAAKFTVVRSRRAARVAAHLPGQHNQQSHGNDVSSPNALKGIGVLGAKRYADLYGDVYDDGGISITDENEVALVARTFESGDMHVSLHLEDGSVQVFEEMDPDSMRQLAYDLETVLAVDETEFEGGDPYDIVADADSDKHGFYVAKDGVGDIRIQPPGDEEDYFEISAEQATEFVQALLNIADTHEEHQNDLESEVQAKRAPRRRSRVAAHLPGQHDQSDHGRKKGLPKLPSVKTPPAPAAAAPKAPAKKAAPRKAVPKPSPSDVEQARLKLERAVKMHGSDRSKWSKKDRDAAAKLDKLIDDGGGDAAKPPAKKSAPKAAPAGEQPAPKPNAKPSPKTLTGSNGRKPKDSQIEAAKAVYEGNFAGFTTSDVTVSESGSAFFTVTGTVRDKSGRQVGKFERAVVRDEDGKLAARHVSLELDSDVQGQGFAQEFNSSLIDWYKANGVDRVELFANYDVGGYAWARAGYDWADEDAADAVRKLLRKAVVGDSLLRGVPSERRVEQRDLAEAMLTRIDSSEFGSADFPTPFEIAQLGRWPGAGKDDSWAGKAVLLGSSWDAVKPL